jgi:hypothetical protein
MKTVIATGTSDALEFARYSRLIDTNASAIIEL